MRLWILLKRSRKNNKKNSLVLVNCILHQHDNFDVIVKLSVSKQFQTWYLVSSYIYIIKYIR